MARPSASLAASSTRMRIAVAAEKILKARQVRRAGNSHQHRSRAAVLDQPDAAQDEGAHDDLADFRRADHQRTDMRRVERQRRAAVAAGPAASERLTPRELAHLAGDLPDMMRRDRRLAIEPIAPHHIDRALEHEPGGSVPLADVEHDLARREVARRPARKALGRLDLRGVEHGKDLLVTLFDDAHAGLLARFRRLGWHRMSPPTFYVQSTCTRGVSRRSRFS